MAGRHRKGSAKAGAHRKSVGKHRKVGKHRR